MSNAKQSIQLGEFIDVKPDKTKNGGYPCFIVRYKRLDDDSNKEQSVQYLSGKLDENSKKVMRDENNKMIQAGDKFVIVKEQDASGKWWNFKEFRKADTFVAKPKYVPNGGGNNAAGAAKGGSYDNLGQQLGNCITNAVNSLGVGKAVEEYHQRALAFALMGDELRKEVEAARAIANQEIKAPAAAEPEEDLPF